MKCGAITFDGSDIKILTLVRFSIAKSMTKSIVVTSHLSPEAGACERAMKTEESPFPVGVGLWLQMAGAIWLLDFECTLKIIRTESYTILKRHPIVIVLRRSLSVDVYINKCVFA